MRLQNPETKVWDRSGVIAKVLDNERREISLEDGSSLVRNTKFIKHEVADTAGTGQDKTGADRAGLSSPIVDRAAEKPRSQRRVRFSVDGSTASSPPAPAVGGQQNLRRSTRLRNKTQVVASSHSPPPVISHILPIHTAPLSHQHTARHSSSSLTGRTSRPFPGTCSHTASLGSPRPSSPSSSTPSSTSTPRPPPTQPSLATLAPKLEPIFTDPVSSIIQKQLDKALGTNSYYSPTSTTEETEMAGDRHDQNTFSDSRSEYSLLSLHSSSVAFTLVVVLCLLVMLCLCRSNISRCYRTSTLWRGGDPGAPAAGAGGFIQGAGAAGGLAQGGAGGGVAYVMPCMQGAPAITCSGGWKPSGCGASAGGSSGGCSAPGHVHGGGTVEELHLRP